mgnify:CR=1 FL=1
MNKTFHRALLASSLLMGLPVAAQAQALKLTSLLIGTMNDDQGVFGTLNNRTTRRFVAGADGKFDALDTNKDGVIDQAELDAAIRHAERAVAISPGLAEAHGALAFLLSTTSRLEDARREGRLAASMEPANWRMQFQAGIAAWGQERLEHLRIVMQQFPALTHAHFAAAYVLIARGELDAADAMLRDALEVQRTSPADRLP